jgi:TetR/AcrR family transcriptional regulator
MAGRIPSSIADATAQLPRIHLPAATGRNRPDGDVARVRHPGTVQRILRAAEENFAERGLAGARIGAIARAARVNKALLYYYFASKEELHRFTLTTLFQQLREQANTALHRGGSPREQLLQFINGYFDFVVAHPNYPRLFGRELMSDEPRMVGLAQEQLRPLQRRLSAVIRTGIAKGEFRRVDPRHTLFSLVGMTVFYFLAAPVLSQLWHFDPLAPPRVAARRRAVLDFMEHALFLPSARKR